MITCLRKVTGSCVEEGLRQGREGRFGEKFRHVTSVRGASGWVIVAGMGRREWK